MNKLKKLIIICGIFIAIVIAAFATLAAYEQHESNKKDNEDLTYASKDIWIWHDKYNRIQIYFNKELGRSTLRKVNIHSSYVVYARKTSDYKLEALVQFITKCSPNKKIETSKKYSNGTPIFLTCNSSGTALTYSAVWDKTDMDFVWNDDLDGFKFYIDFGDWDFTKLDQEITLSKAK